MTNILMTWVYKWQFILGTKHWVILNVLTVKWIRVCVYVIVCACV